LGGIFARARTGTQRPLVTNETTSPTRREAAEASALLNTIETAAAMNISKRGLQELVAGRKIGYIKIGRNIRFHRDDIAKFIEAHRCQPIGWKSANKGGNA
jgi:excisionase family DNA binding protein